MSRKEDYLPTSDAEMQRWLGNFTNKLTPMLADLGLTPDDVATMLDDVPLYEDAVEEHLKKQVAAKAASAEKRSARASLESQIRPIVRRINQHPNMDNGKRALLGLNVYKDTRTRREVGREVPALHVETGIGVVILHFGTSPTNEGRNSKPDWALGCNIYRKMPGEESYRLVSMATTSPFVDEINEAAVTVSYFATYAGRHKNAEGPQSASVTVAAGGGISRKAA